MVFIEYQSVCPFVGIGPPLFQPQVSVACPFVGIGPPTPPQASVSPVGPKGGRSNTPLRVRGRGAERLQYTLSTRMSLLSSELAPPPQASASPHLDPKGGGGSALPCGWGGGGSQFVRLERKPGTLCIWASPSSRSQPSARRNAMKPKVWRGTAFSPV